MESTKPSPRVGIAAVIQDSEGRLLMGNRKGSHGAGQWAFPGGHLEFGESYAECAERESLEETGLKVKAVKTAAFTNDVFASENKHYITIFVLCEREDRTQHPQLLEPDKCDKWDWLTWNEIRDFSSSGTGSLFLPVVNLLAQHPDVEMLFANGA